MDNAHWAAYNDAQAGRAPRDLCRQVLALAGDGAGRDAVDLGCGAGVETRALLAAGWRVYALDSAPGTRDRVHRTVGTDLAARLTIDTGDLTGRADLPAGDLIHAGYALPFVGPHAFPRVWGLIRASLRPGGWLAVNLFGDRDSWAPAAAGRTFLTEDAVRALFDGLAIVRFAEQDEDGPSFSGPKHWHVFDVIARAPDEAAVNPRSTRRPG